MDWLYILNIVIGLWLTCLGVVWFRERNRRPHAMKWVALNWIFAVANFGCAWFHFSIESIV